MNNITPTVRTLTKLLLAREAEEKGHHEVTMEDTMSAFEKIRLVMKKIVGVSGFLSLLAATLIQAKGEIPWLNRVQADKYAVLQGVELASEEEAVDRVLEGCSTLLALLIGKIVALIGNELTVRVLQIAWPDVSFDSLQLGEKDAL